MRILTISIAVAAMLAAASCDVGSGTILSLSNPPDTTGSTSNSVSVVDNAFSPSATRVAAGTTVTWTWNGINQHNVTFDDGATSATQSSGTYARAFTLAGTYPYHCTIHGIAMSGTVTVH